jgi:hypothetical protein
MKSSFQLEKSGNEVVISPLPIKVYEPPEICPWTSKAAVDPKLRMAALDLI